MKIAWIIYHDYGQYLQAHENEDFILLEKLKNLGYDIVPCFWTDERDWNVFDVVLIKSPWDYFLYPEAFQLWLDTLQKANINVLNPVEIIRWNHHKKYLTEIADKGFSVPWCEWIPQKGKAALEVYFEQWNTDTLVVKPCISAGAHDTFVVKRQDIIFQQQQWPILLNKADMLVQIFVPEIASSGEISLLFFGGKYSHAIQKTAKNGDFRVQFHYGGASTVFYPEADVIQKAEAIVAQFAADCLYARVDGIQTKDDFLLMELELIEPFYFLKDVQDADENYLSALQEKLNQ